MDLQAFIEKMSSFSSGQNGVTRLPFTEESKHAFEYIVETMKSMGLCVYTDKYGTIQGHLAGSCKNSVIIGSHYDTVINGGKYDGVAGIAVGLAVANYFTSNNIVPKYSIDLLALNDEEGVRFNTGFTSSKAITGNLQEETVYDRESRESLKIILSKKMYGKDVITLYSTLKNAKCFIEVHIEQGCILENHGCDIGIVDDIVGIKRYFVTIGGFSGHAGTIPMEYRSDALVAASKVIYDLSKIPYNYKDMVLTVGSMNVYPNAVNVIPDKVVFSIDVRSSRKEDLKKVHTNIRNVCENSVVTNFPNNYSVLIEPGININPLILDVKQAAIIEKVVQTHTSRYRHMHSGAGHDAQIFQPYMPVSMLFVPSHKGYSHRPDEYTDEKYIKKAVSILCDYLISEN